MPKIVAIIDIGTNTFNLLIVERYTNDFKTLYTERIGVGLGHGGITKGIISKDAYERGVTCLKKYNDICTHYKVNSILAFGTSALRHATNAQEFIDAVKSTTSITIKTLTGQQEAQFIYNGIAINYNFKSKTAIMDIGGGSTEFIYADQTGILNKHSFEIGVSRIYQLFDLSDPLSLKDIETIEQYLESKIGTQLDNFRADTLIGSSGSFETFYELTHQKAYPENKYLSLTLNQVLTTLNHLISSTFASRTQNPFIIPIRLKMLPIAAVKTKWIINKLGIQNLVVSPYSLKEGAIFSDKQDDKA